MPDVALPHDVARAFADRLKAARERAGMTQEAAASASNMSRQHYQNMESAISDRASGRPVNPRLSTLLALCAAFNVEMSELMREAEPLYLHEHQHRKL